MSENGNREADEDYHQVDYDETGVDNQHEYSNTDFIPDQDETKTSGQAKQRTLPPDENGDIIVPNVLFISRFRLGTTTEAEVRKHFDKYGPIKSVSLRHKVVYVEYENDDDAKRAKQQAHHGPGLGSDSLIVDFKKENKVKPRPDDYYSRISSRDQHGNEGGGGFRSRGGDGRDHRDNQPRDRQQQQFSSNNDDRYGPSSNNRGPSSNERRYNDNSGGRYSNEPSSYSQNRQDYYEDRYSSGGNRPDSRGGPPPQDHYRQGPPPKDNYRDNRPGPPPPLYPPKYDAPPAPYHDDRKFSQYDNPPYRQPRGGPAPPPPNQQYNGPPPPDYGRHGGPQGDYDDRRGPYPPNKRPYDNMNDYGPPSYGNPPSGPPSRMPPGRDYPPMGNPRPRSPMNRPPNEPPMMDRPRGGIEPSTYAANAARNRGGDWGDKDRGRPGPPGSGFPGSGMSGGNRGYEDGPNSMPNRDYNMPSRDNMGHGDYHDGRGEYRGGMDSYQQKRTRY